MDKLADWLKEILLGNKPVIRKLRILRYVACVIILFTMFCDLYWNLLAYVDLPCAPLLPEGCRNILNSTGAVIFGIWLLYRGLYHNLYKIVCEKHWLKLSYIDTLLDVLFTAYFLVYALNIGIEYANGLLVQIKTETVLVIVYLVRCAFVKSYAVHQYNYRKNKDNEYTDYCDSEGKEIPVGAKVFYKGKGYKVVRHEKVYRLLPHDESIITSNLIALEDAASDMEGKLILRK